MRPEIYQHGELVAIVYGNSEPIQEWVQAIAAEAKARVDWHIFAGLGRVLHLGDRESRRRVDQAIEQSVNSLSVAIGAIYVQRFPLK